MFRFVIIQIILFLQIKLGLIAPLTGDLLIKTFCEVINPNRSYSFQDNPASLIGVMCSKLTQVAIEQKMGDRP